MQDKKQERKYFDRFTAEKPWNAFTEKTYDKVASLFARLVSPKKSDRIIDMGCGTGEFTNKLNQHFKNVEGYDISENCILTARKRYKSIKFEVKDIESTKLENGSVDVLVYCGVLHHFTNIEKVIKEAKRILKKDGKVFIFEPNAINPVLWLFRNKKSPFKSNKLKTPNEEFLAKEKIKEAFEKEGFKAIKIGCISGISYAKEHFQRLFPFPFFYIVHAYNLFDAMLGKTFLRKSYGSFIYGYFKK